MVCFRIEDDLCFGAEISGTEVVGAEVVAMERIRAKEEDYRVGTETCWLETAEICFSLAFGAEPECEASLGDGRCLSWPRGSGGRCHVENQETRIDAGIGRLNETVRVRV
ncbi:hypothetical protein NDU88_003764 [Pleurodeles waltl]|uniref:Uncharacterized protein n=1 Tax=Pleurodeles waltl TaxID=8319 RepID=A0AAV7PD45_PLEWA|nr:hypothetical protein NDU88_003764 [Pleurodeles waltl]